MTIVVSFGVRLSRNAGKIPKPIHRPFSEWPGAWITPPLVAADYWLIVDAELPLSVNVVDEATCNVVPKGAMTVGAKYGNKWIVGEFRAVGGHRYRIDIGPEQVAALSGHRLTLDITGMEREKRMMRALRE